jgi:hypothetical protein
MADLAELVASATPPASPSPPASPRSPEQDQRDSSEQHPQDLSSDKASGDTNAPILEDNNRISIGARSRSTIGRRTSSRVIINRRTVSLDATNDPSCNNTNNNISNSTQPLASTTASVSTNSSWGGNRMNTIGRGRIGIGSRRATVSVAKTNNTDMTTSQNSTSKDAINSEDTDSKSVSRDSSSKNSGARSSRQSRRTAHIDEFKDVVDLMCPGTCP